MMNELHLYQMLYNHVIDLSSAYWVIVKCGANLVQQRNLEAMTILIIFCFRIHFHTLARKNKHLQELQTKITFPPI